jgi:hypothetical protein
MDTRDRGIATQVAFKGAIDIERDVDLTDPQGQARFHEVFEFLQHELMEGILATGSQEEQIAQVIQGEFPGTQVVSGPAQQQYAQPQYTTPGPPQYQLQVRGNQFGPLPDWLYEQAAQKGVTEVWDNRQQAQGNKRPWFRSTSGGDNAPAFWPPR